MRRKRRVLRLERPMRWQFQMQVPMVLELTVEVGGEEASAGVAEGFSPLSWHEGYVGGCRPPLDGI